MFRSLVYCHSVVRWLLLISLILSVISSMNGYFSNGAFLKRDNFLRQWTTSIAHLQLLVGIIIYTQSPMVKYFWQNFHVAVYNMEAMFFGIFHICFMLAGIIIITIGSALAKRRSSDREKCKTVFVWYIAALVVIFAAIPWPFSPLANRPYLNQL